MSYPPSRPSHAFSLVEIVIAVAIFALAVPAVLAILGIFSESARDSVDEAEVAGMLTATRLYLDGEMADTEGTTCTFQTVYGWVHGARVDPADAMSLYAYKSSASQTSYEIAVDAPSMPVVGKVMVVEVHAPLQSLIPNSVLVTDVDDYEKAFLPVTLSLYAVSSLHRPPTAAERVGKYPIVISR